MSVRGSIFLFLSILAVAVCVQPSPAWSQGNASSIDHISGRSCGTMDKMRERGTDFTRSASTSDCDLTRSDNLLSYVPTSVAIIPVWVHIIRDDDGEQGEISDEMVKSQIDILNEDYRALPGSLGDNGVDSMIQFRLAGITRYNNTDYYNDYNEYEYKSEMQKDPEHYLNIYTNTASWYLGYSYMPSEYAGSVLDGVVINHSYFGLNPPYAEPYDLGRTTTHEVGHYLGLFHPFDAENNGAPWTCPSGESPYCYQNGDLICDTNPQLYELYECPSDSATCDSLDPIHNYMNYTDDFCMEEFTYEQVLRMHCSLRTYRPDLALLGRKLAVEKTGSGQGEIASSPEGIECGDKCTDYFPDGAQVSISAVPDEGSAFDGWLSDSLGGCRGNEVCVVTLNEDRQLTATINLDQDSDGIGDDIENQGPYNGDGNRDGVQDSRQQSVTTFKNTYGDFITLTSEDGYPVSGVRFTDIPSGFTGSLPAEFPSGFIGFTISGLTAGGAAVVKVIFHGRPDSINGYYNYGPTTDLEEAHFYDFSLHPWNFYFFGRPGASLNNFATDKIITLYLQNGQKGDNDLDAENGSITTMGGPVVKTASEASEGSSKGGCFLDAVAGGDLKL